MSGTVNGHRRMNAEALWRAQLELSDRHRKWGDDCPAVDLDYLMAEFNHGIPVAIVDYKHHQANLAQTSAKTHETLSGFYDKAGSQIPFMVARYWPRSWAFKIRPVNDPAVAFIRRVKPELLSAEWIPLTEYQFVWLLYRLRKDALTLRDNTYLSRLNKEMPPAEEPVSVRQVITTEVGPELERRRNQAAQ